MPCPRAKIPPIRHCRRFRGWYGNSWPALRTAQNLLVVKTSVGSAQPVAAALDGEDWPEAIGTIAGDDTILIVCLDKKAAKRVEGRIQGLLA